jgi:hypothetical protein
LQDKVILSNGLTALFTSLEDPSMVNVLNICRKGGFHFLTLHPERFFALTIPFPNEEVHFIYTNWSDSSMKAINEFLEESSWERLEEAVLIVYDGKAFRPNPRQCVTFASAAQYKTPPKIAALLEQ